MSGNGSDKFQLGKVVSTPGAFDALAAADATPWEFIGRHVHGDWGDLDEFDKAQNERALVDGSRLLSAYTLSDGTKIWVITEADRSSTTILLPEEY